jgi:hypothetical protein
MPWLPMHLSPRCGAHSRRTGQPCRNGAMPNGRCRMHGCRVVVRKPVQSGPPLEIAGQTSVDAICDIHYRVTLYHGCRCISVRGSAYARRAGQPCRNGANAKCRMHGGATPTWRVRSLRSRGFFCCRPTADGYPMQGELPIHLNPRCGAVPAGVAFRTHHFRSSGLQ